MKKHFTVQIMIFVSLLSVAAILNSCKKSDESSSSGSTSLTVTTNSVSVFGQRWATLSGTVNVNNQTAIIAFDYGTSASYGSSISADPDTLSDNKSTTVSAVISSLVPDKTYYYRVKAIISSDTTYGSEMTFTTKDSIKSTFIFNPNLKYGSVSDIDGNTYKTIEIGTQTWMAENLNVTKLNDGTPIPFITNATAWTELSTPAYCWYNYDSVSYGALYNWYVVDAASNGNRNVCPSGWHIPSNNELATLITFSGGEVEAGGKLKETGTTHWYSTNSYVTNETGFTAIPAGYRYYSGTFNNIRRYSYWWSSTTSSSLDAYCRNLYFDYNNAETGVSNKKSGLSIRCIKD
ncbi:MAG: fibrobacter succinogenes major paralogous domain-containing protein [Bacteroidales bacterium]